MLYSGREQIAQYLKAIQKAGRNVTLQWLDDNFSFFSLV